MIDVKLPKKVKVNWEEVSSDRPCIVVIFGKNNFPSMNVRDPCNLEVAGSHHHSLTDSGEGWYCYNTWENWEVEDGREMIQVNLPGTRAHIDVVACDFKAYSKVNSFFDLEDEDLLIPLAMVGSEREDHVHSLLCDMDTARALAKKVFEEKGIYLFLSKSLVDPTCLGYKILPSLSKYGMVVPEGIHCPMGYKEIELLYNEESKDEI